jgi:hypothetical protein
MSSSAECRPSTSRGACAFVAILFTLLVFAWTAARVHYVAGGNWTIVFCTGAAVRVPPDLAAGTYRSPATGYDGQFYRFLAHDPFLRAGYFRYVDAPQLRFRRLLVPLAAWGFGFGQSQWIDGAYLAVELLFLALGGYWCARLLVRRGRSPWWGLLFLVAPATLASFDRMLVDGPLAALFAGFLLYCEEERWARVWVLAMLAALTRETGFFLGAALALDCLWHRRWRQATWFAASGIPAAAWFAYVAARLPHERAVTIFAAPAWGIIRRLFWFRPYPDPALQLLLRVTDLLAVAGLAISLILAVRWALGCRVGPVTICVGLFAALALVLGGPDHMTDAFGYGRPVSPLLLWVMVEAVSRKKWLALAPPLCVSLSVSLVFALPLVTVVKGLLGR